MLQPLVSLQQGIRNTRPIRDAASEYRKVDSFDHANNDCRGKIRLSDNYRSELDEESDDSEDGLLEEPAKEEAALDEMLALWSE